MAHETILQLRDNKIKLQQNFQEVIANLIQSKNKTKKKVYFINWLQTGSQGVFYYDDFNTNVQLIMSNIFKACITVNQSCLIISKIIIVRNYQKCNFTILQKLTYREV